jgi:hypothetical protein
MLVLRHIGESRRDVSRGRRTPAGDFETLPRRRLELQQVRVDEIGQETPRKTLDVEWHALHTAGPSRHRQGASTTRITAGPADLLYRFGRFIADPLVGRMYEMATTYR